MRRDPGSRERGIALVSVLFGATLILLLLLTMLTMTEMSGRMVARQLTSQGQALNAASAGLNESVSWFVHQKGQPVTVFSPKLDLTATPKVNETEDPATGLVRTYEISTPGRLWGRYTLRKNGGVVDVSKLRGKKTDGAVWRLESEGLVYVRNDKTKAPDQAPNVVVARSTMRGEIERLVITLPANAAINAFRADNVNVSKSGRVQGGATGIGVAYPDLTGAVKNQGTITGTPATNTIPPTGTPTGGFSLEEVFTGTTQQELLSMADLVVDDESQLPNPLPAMSLVVVKGNATFTPNKQLKGSGILVVLGNLILSPQSNTYYSGLIWVGGNCNISPPSVINGSIVAQSNVTLSAGSEISEVDYDRSFIDQVMLQKGNYLFSRTPWILGKIGG